MDPAAYIGLFAAVIVTWVGISGPGEAALVSAGAVAARSEAEILAVLGIAFGGTVAGSVLAYCAGRAGGRRMVLKPGPLLRLRARALAKSEALVRRRPLLASLLTPGWFAGINQTPLRPFALGAGLAGFLWTLAIGLGSFSVGPSLLGLYDEAERGLAILAVAGVIGVALLVLARRAGLGTSRSTAAPGGRAPAGAASLTLSPDQR